MATQKTTVTNKEVVNLISASFDESGYPVKKGSKTRSKKAIEILESDVSYYGETVNGWDAHNCLLIIAYPDKSI